MQARLIGKDNTWLILMQHVHDCINSTKLIDVIVIQNL
jgi:hypothetical protein